MSTENIGKWEFRKGARRHMVTWLKEDGTSVRPYLLIGKYGFELAGGPRHGWSEVTKLDTDGADALQTRVTATRFLAVGLFALAANRRPARSTCTSAPPDRTRVASNHRIGGTAIMRSARSLLVVVLAAVTLSACSGSAASSGGPGVYTGESNDASQVIAVPAEASDKTMAAVVAYAKKTGYTEPLAFVTVELRNNGADKVANCPIRVVTESGDTVEFSPAWRVISDMLDLVPTSDVSTYNEGVRLFNSMNNVDTALPGATTTALYAAHGAIASVKSVFAGTQTLVLTSFMEECDQKLSKQG